MSESSPQTPVTRKETKSDIISHATIQEYIMSHAKPNGGLKGFLQSNLFAALLLWCLSQAVLVGGFIVTFYMRTSQLSEWKGSVDGTLKRMDEWGTVHGHYANDAQDKLLNGIEPRIKRLEEDTRHLEVFESEHRRLTSDVEKLKDGKK